MLARIIVENTTGMRWLYVAEKNIRFKPYEPREGEPKLVSVKVENVWSQGNSIPASRFIVENFRITGQLEVPDEIVAFALEAAAMQSERVVAALQAKGWGNRATWRDIQKAIAAVGEQAPDESIEKGYASQLQRLIEAGGGLN